MKKINLIFGILCLSALLLCVGSAAEQTQQAPPAGGPDDNCTDYAKVATTLGLTEDAVKAALHQEPDYTSAAATLGVSADALKAAMGKPGEKKQELSAVATTLGVTEDAIKAALGTKEQQGGPDIADMAKKLGVSEDVLKSAMGTPGQGQPADPATIAKAIGKSEDEIKTIMGAPGQGGQNLSGAATKLGVTEEGLKAALDAAKTC